MQIGEVLLRTLLAFISLLILTRILGKKQLSQLTFFNYVTGITFGSIAATFAMDANFNIWNGLSSLVLWAALTFITGWITLKNKRLRHLLDGEPTIVIKNGVIQKKALAGLRLNLNDLSMLLRDHKVFSVQEVEYAILESNGTLSVLQKLPHRTATKQDVGAPFKPDLYIPTELIVDGQIIDRNLKELDLTPEWLQQQLQSQGVTDSSTVFYAELEADGSLHINARRDELH